MRDLAYRAFRCANSFRSQCPAEPTVEQIAAALGESCDAVLNAIESVAQPMSLYEPVYGDGGDSIYVMDQIRDTGSSDEIWLEDIALKEAMKHLSEGAQNSENEILQRKTQMEIADEIGISQAQVSRLEKGAIETAARNVNAARAQNAHVLHARSRSKALKAYEKHNPTADGYASAFSRAAPK